MPTKPQFRDRILLDKDDMYLLDDNTIYIDNSTGYARVLTGIKDQKYIKLHHLILKAPPGLMVDHINGDKLDNRRSNLRIVTQMQNQQNRKVGQKNNKSGYKGVVWRKDGQCWSAQIRIDTKLKHLGFFSDILEAAQAYNHAAKEHFGTYARTN